MPIGCAKAAMMSGAAGGDPFWPYVVFLFQPKSEHLSFLDLSASGHTISTTNSPTLSSTAPFPGHKSGLFVAASSQYAEMADSPDWDFSSHFTVEVLARQVSFTRPVPIKHAVRGRQRCHIWMRRYWNRRQHVEGACFQTRQGGLRSGPGLGTTGLPSVSGQRRSFGSTKISLGRTSKSRRPRTIRDYSAAQSSAYVQELVATGYGDCYIAAVRITNGAARYGGGTPPTPTEPFPAKG
jgi:hypothetical protein